MISEYSIHGLRLDVQTNNWSMLEAIQPMLGCFHIKEADLPADIRISLFDNEHTLQARILSCKQLTVLTTASKDNRFDLSRFGLEGFSLSFDREQRLYLAEFGHRVRILYSLVQGWAEGYCLDPEFLPRATLANQVFKFVLTELLKSKGFFPIHCSALDRKGKGILLPGYSGSGKSTACMALIMQGYGYLSDDFPILAFDAENRLKLLNFPEPLNLTPATIDLIPDLSFAQCEVNNLNRKKMRLSTEAFFPGSTVMTTDPSLIVFPEVHGNSLSTLEKLDAGEALSRLMPHSVLAFDKKTTADHFHVLSELVSITNHYVLHFGRDLSMLSRILDAVC